MMMKYDILKFSTESCSHEWNYSQCFPFQSSVSVYLTFSSAEQKLHLLSWFWPELHEVVLLSLSLCGLQEFWYDLKLNILLLLSLWTLLVPSSVIILYFYWTFIDLSSWLESYLEKSAISCNKEMCFDYRGRMYCSFILVIPNVQNYLHIKPSKLVFRPSAKNTSGSGVRQHYCFSIIEDQFSGGQSDFFILVGLRSHVDGIPCVHRVVFWSVWTAADSDHLSSLGGDEAHFSQF